jgi:hypothetical protein
VEGLETPDVNEQIEICSHGRNPLTRNGTHRSIQRAWPKRSTGRQHVEGNFWGVRARSTKAIPDE